MNTFGELVSILLALASIVWLLAGYPIGYELGRKQGICETTYSGANYIYGECLISAKP